MGTQESTYVTLQTKKWRGLVYDYDAMLIGLSDDSCLVCLTDFERTWIMQNLDYMRWTTRWQNLSISPTELIQLADNLEEKLMSCSSINPLWLEYIYDQAIQEQLGVFDNDYTGTPSSVNSNSPDDFFTGNNSPDRRTALCTAITLYIYSYAANWLSKAEIALGISVVAGFLLSLTIVGGVIAGTLLAGIGLITLAAVNAMKDQTALDNVICCMFDNMDGVVISQANFETALNACGFIVGSNEAIIRDIIASDLNQLSNYLSFINSLGDAFVLAENDVSLCPCPDTWSQTFDFTVNDGGFVVLSAGQAVYVAGVGWRAVNNTSNETRLYIKKTGLPDYNLNRVKATMTFTGDTSVTYNALAFVGDDGFGGNELLYNNTAFGNANTSFDVSFSGDSTEKIQLQIYRTGFVPSPAPINTIQELTFYGNGLNPF